MLHFSFINKVVIFGGLLLAAAYALPNVVPNQWLEGTPFPQNKINLGLDLQGGSHLALRVQVEGVIKRSYENLEEEVRQTLRAEKLNYRNLLATNSNVKFIAFKPQQHAKILKNLRRISGLEIQQEGQNFTIAYNAERQAELQEQAMSQTLEILRSRVDEFGVSEPVIQRQGEDRIIIQLPGIDDVERAKGIIGRTAQLTFHLVDEGASVSGRLPVGRTVMYEEDFNISTGRSVKIPYVLHSRPVLTGEFVSGANTGFEATTGQPAVYIQFDGRGTRKFGKITTENTGRRLAIVLDGVVYSAPSLNEPILGGSAQITGSFTPQAAEDLATVLRAGALPAKVEVVEERTVGPSLGQDSIDAGKKAILIGFAGILVIMLFFYRLFGVFANVALLANVVLIMGIMSAFGFTLTLPGMAGILLTIGMAVDANVLIFERIKEEFMRGAKPAKALEAGFKSAFATILDANITTLIAAVVLFAMGSGPIKGFALTLSVGILSSMFTAIMLTRYMMVAWLRMAKPKEIK